MQDVGRRPGGAHGLGAPVWRCCMLGQTVLFLDCRQQASMPFWHDGFVVQLASAYLARRQATNSGVMQGQKLFASIVESKFLAGIGADVGGDSDSAGGAAPHAIPGAGFSVQCAACSSSGGVGGLPWRVPRKWPAAEKHVNL
jgi:hypothetical protein